MCKLKITYTNGLDFSYRRKFNDFVEFFFKLFSLTMRIFHLISGGFEPPNRPRSSVYGTNIRVSDKLRTVQRE